MRTGVPLQQYCLQYEILGGTRTFGPHLCTEVWTKSLYQPRVAKHRNTNTIRVPLSPPEFIWELRYLRCNSIFMNSIFYCVLQISPSILNIANLSLFL